MNDVKSLRSWLFPTACGSFLGIFGWLFLGVFGDNISSLSGGMIQEDYLVATILYALFLSSWFFMALICVDVHLLSRGWRRLPSGANAFLSSMMAPSLTSFLWVFFSPETVLQFVLMVFASTAIVTHVVRFSFGKPLN